MKIQNPIEELRIAYSILDGIPNKRFNLQLIANKTSLDCGTIACGVGWLALHPRYQARGFRLWNDRSGSLSESIGVRNIRTDERWHPFSYNRAASAMLGIPSEDADRLFAQEYWTDRNIGNDKRVLLRRLRKYIQEHSK